MKNIKDIIFICVAITGLNTFFVSASELSDSISEVYSENINGIHILPITIDNNQYKFIFDTGATITTLSQDVFQNGNYKVVDSFPVFDAAKTTKFLKAVKIPRLQIGNKEFFSTKVVLQPQFNYSEVFGCEKIDGILGYDIIKQMKWKIDNHTNKIYLSSDINTLISENEVYKIKFREKNNTILVNTKINGAKTFLQVDTGFNKKISINKFLYDYLKQKKSAFSEVQFKGWTKTTFYGKIQGTYQLLKLDTFEIGDLSFNKPIAHHSTNSHSILGNEFFKKFVVILDPSKKNILLEPIKSDVKKHNPVFDVTLTADYKTNTIIVKNISIKSRLNEILKPEVQILKINDINISSFSRSELCNFWNNTWPGYFNNETIKITVPDEKGNKKEVELVNLNL